MGTAACVVVVPMLGRPDAAQPLADSLAASQADARLLFMVSPGQPHVERACAATGADLRRVEWPRGPGDYARKINLARRLTREPWLFTGASDLVFWPGWLSEALEVGEHGDGVGVVGTQDQGNPMVKRGHMSTHSLVRRSYVPYCVHDQPGNIYCTLYDHNYCDMELVGYAQSRGQFLFARRSIVEHRHPNWRKAMRDPTYDVGMEHFEDDKRLYQQRSMHWWVPPTHRARQRHRLRQ